MIAVFDVIGWNGDLRRSPLIDRLEALQALNLTAYTPKSVMANDKAELITFFKDTTSLGYEGIVAKNLNESFPAGPCTWAKLKYKDQSDYPVLALDPVKERIEIAVPNPHPAGKNIPVIVGVKAPNRYKVHIKVGDMVTIEHQGVLASGSLRHPVLIKKKEWR